MSEDVRAVAVAPPRVAYLVSRFPLATETFILRELMAVNDRLGDRCRLLSLFDGEAPKHPEAESWTSRLEQASVAGAARGFLHWGVRKPIVLSRIVARIVREHRSSTSRLLRSLVAALLALDHARALSANPVDHIHAHFATYPAEAARAIKELTGIDYSITPHAHDIFVDTHGLAGRLSAAKFVAAVSHFHRGYFDAFLPTGTITPIVRYGLDMSLYTYKRRAGIGSTARVLCVAAFREYKGHSVLLEALTDPRLSRLELILVGDGPLRAAITADLNRRGLGDRVTCLGVLDQAQVSAQLEAADFYVQPSIIASNGDTEGLPVSLLEAAAAGLPIIATNVAGTGDLVEHGHTGLLCEPGDASALAEAMAEILAGPGAAVERAERARARVQRRHSIERSADRLVELISAHSVER